MKKICTFMLICVLAISVSACTKEKSDSEPVASVTDSSQAEISEDISSEGGVASASNLKDIFLPEKSTVLTEDEESIFIEVDMTYEDAVKFYEEVVETLGAKGEVSDMDSEEDLWAFTGTYGKDNESLLSITVSPSEEGVCKVSIHY